MRTNSWWWYREKSDLLTDVKIAIDKFQIKFHVSPKTVIVHANEYNGEKLSSIEFKLTLSNAERRKIIILWP